MLQFKGKGSLEATCRSNQGLTPNMIAAMTSVSERLTAQGSNNQMLRELRAFVHMPLGGTILLPSVVASRKRQQRQPISLPIQQKQLQRKDQAYPIFHSNPQLDLSALPPRLPFQHFRTSQAKFMGPRYPNTSGLQSLSRPVLCVDVAAQGVKGIVKQDPTVGRTTTALKPDPSVDIALAGLTLRRPGTQHRVLKTARKSTEPTKQTKQDQQSKNKKVKAKQQPSLKQCGKKKCVPCGKALGHGVCADCTEIVAKDRVAAKRRSNERRRRRERKAQGSGRTGRSGARGCKNEGVAMDRSTGRRSRRRVQQCGQMGKGEGQHMKPRTRMPCWGTHKTGRCGNVAADQCVRNRCGYCCNGQACIRHLGHTTRATNPTLPATVVAPAATVRRPDRQPTKPRKSATSPPKATGNRSLVSIHAGATALASTRAATIVHLVAASAAAAASAASALIASDVDHDSDCDASAGDGDYHDQSTAAAKFAFPPRGSQQPKARAKSRLGKRTATAAIIADAHSSRRREITFTRVKVDHNKSDRASTDTATTEKGTGASVLNRAGRDRMSEDINDCDQNDCLASVGAFGGGTGDRADGADDPQHDDHHKKLACPSSANEREQAAPTTMKETESPSLDVGQELPEDCDAMHDKHRSPLSHSLPPLPSSQIPRPLSPPNSPLSSLLPDPSIFCLEEDDWLVVLETSSI